LNPAVLIRLKQGEVVEERWVFSKFPTFQQSESGGVACEVRLDCPAERERPSPDYVLVTTGGKEAEAWLRFEGKVEVMPLEVGKAKSIPASRYTFAVERFVPSGELVETYKPSSGSGAVTVVKVRAAGPDGREEATWLEAGQTRVVPTSAGPMMVSFGSPSAAQGKAGHP
jgi:hypothetical protein